MSILNFLEYPVSVSVEYERNKIKPQNDFKKIRQNSVSRWDADKSKGRMRLKFTPYKSDINDPNREKTKIGEVTSSYFDPNNDYSAQLTIEEFPTLSKRILIIRRLDVKEEDKHSLPLND